MSTTDDTTPPAMDRETFLRLTQEAGFHAPISADGYMGLAYDNRRDGETGGSLEKLVELVEANATKETE